MAVSANDSAARTDPPHTLSSAAATRPARFPRTEGKTLIAWLPLGGRQRDTHGGRDYRTACCVGWDPSLAASHEPAYRGHHLVNPLLVLAVLSANHAGMGVIVEQSERDLVEHALDRRDLVRTSMQ